MPLLLLLSTTYSVFAGEPWRIYGTVYDQEAERVSCRIAVLQDGDTIESDAAGNFSINAGNRESIALVFFHEEFETKTLSLERAGKDSIHLRVVLNRNISGLGEVVISGTMRAVEKSKSPVPVETFKTAFFRRNASATLFESVGMINGVRPQLNCNVCNTGDIHINGMEGPYTMVLIDGMPIMSSLASVYGLVGIPTGMTDRIEVVRGPASALYGSESMGGLINIITKPASGAPRLYAESQMSSWGEWNSDIALRNNTRYFSLLTGINYFQYTGLYDKNKDGFTDLPVQHRISFFQKADFNRKHKREASLALRYVYEDRWGGQTNWSTEWRGTDSIYGESIYTNRVEIIGKYALPVKAPWMLHYSWTWHQQNSVYGVVPYLATQRIAFAQLFRNFKMGKKQNLLSGAAFRHTVYDDNTIATQSPDGLQNRPDRTPLPGVFFQYENEVLSRLSVLAGYRYDYSLLHKSVHSPRFAVKYNFNANRFIRLNTGTGFRVVNLFTEEHAALTGDRKVVVLETLSPERSWSASANMVQKIKTRHFYLSLDGSAFYTRFSNKIIPDYLTDPNSIIYTNLHGYAVSRGWSLNTDMNFNFPLTLSAGITYADVFQTIYGKKEQQWFAPKWSGNFNAGYTIIPLKLVINVSGMVNGPMRLPVLPNDFRPEFSPLYCLANLQVSRKHKYGLEWYTGIKNLLNFVPQNPLMRPFDPFDKTAKDPVSNPYGYTFDTGYNYAPLQGRRFYLGIRWTI